MLLCYKRICVCAGVCVCVCVWVESEQCVVGHVENGGYLTNTSFLLSLQRLCSTCCVRVCLTWLVRNFHKLFPVEFIEIPQLETLTRFVSGRAFCHSKGGFLCETFGFFLVSIDFPAIRRLIHVICVSCVVVSFSLFTHWIYSRSNFLPLNGSQFLGFPDYFYLFPLLPPLSPDTSIFS